MRIGIDCRMFRSNFTGIGRYTYELVQHFIALNDKLEEPHQIILFFNDPEFKDFKPNNENVKKVKVNCKHYSFGEQWRFLKSLRKEKLDLMHFTHFNMPLLYRRPFTVTIHDLTLSLFPGKKMNKWYYRLAYNLVVKRAIKGAKKVIAVSENTKRDILEQFNVDAGKVEVIYHGVSPEFKKVKSERRLAKTVNKFGIDRPFLLYTGVWRNHKNLERLIRAFEKVQDKCKNILLVLTGKEDPFYPEVKETIKELKLGKYVKLTGLVEEDELVDLYNAAEIYVFPSLYEGFGFPPLEAMQCGTPVVAADRSSIPEVCGKDNAMFFDPENVEQMADKICKLLGNEKLQKKLVQNGFKRIKDFSWKDMAKKSFDLIVGAVK